MVHRRDRVQVTDRLDQVRNYTRGPARPSSHRPQHSAGEHHGRIGPQYMESHGRRTDQAQLPPTGAARECRWTTFGEVIVLTDELLDYPVVESDAAPLDPLDLVWRAYIALEEAGSASYRLSGGWTDRACNYTFGVRRGPIELSIGDFRPIKDDPAQISLDFHTSQFYIAFSRKDAEWLHWQLSPGGTWEKVEREIVVDASSYWLWNGRLHRTIRSVLMDGSPEDISVDETADGNLRLQVTMDDSYVNMWDWTGIDSLNLTLMLDPKTYALAGYTWELPQKPGRESRRVPHIQGNGNRCSPWGRHNGAGSDQE